MPRGRVFGVPDVEGDSVSQDIIGLALKQGYWTWEFYPTYRSNIATAQADVHWAARQRHDRTLREDGSRSGRFPGWRHPLPERFPVGAAPYRVDYDFVTRLVVARFG